MKAFEYYRHYKDGIMRGDDGVGNALMGEMCGEAAELCKVRGVKTRGGQLACLKEMNQKWNAMGQLFIKEYGYSPLIRDGFKNVALQLFPELAKEWSR